jgi:hypothetical protein
MNCRGSILLTCSNSVAHYMVGGISEEHVKQDIIDAKALGLDGFALNFGKHHVHCVFQEETLTYIPQTNSNGGQMTQ